MSRSRDFSNSDLSSNSEAAPLLRQSGMPNDGDDLVDNHLELEPAETSECMLLVSQVNPGLLDLDELPFKHSAYIRFKDRLFYINKETDESNLVFLQEDAALLFDLEFNLRDPFKNKKLTTYNDFSSRPLPLSGKELNKIQLLTGHRHPQARPVLPELSDWQKKNGCDLLISSTPPAELDLNDLPITNAAYIRYKNELWHVRKNRSWLEKIFFKERTLLKDIQGEELERFDLVMKTTSSQHQHLTDKQLAKAAVVAKYAHKTLWQAFLAGFGYFCSAFIAVGSGVSTAGAFITLNLVTGGLASVGAALLFAAGTAVNWWIFKRYVSPVLIDLLGREKFLIDEDGQPLSIWKKIAMGVALALSVSVGATFGALTYGSTFTLSTAFTFLAVAAPVFPYVAAALAGVTLICMTALMIKDISDLIKKKDVIGECKKFLKNLVSTDPELPQNKGKSHGRILAERIATIVMTAAFLPLACFGLYMTMNACAPGVKQILIDKIPGISATAADAIAGVVSLGLAFIGQIPFGIQAAFQTIAKIFSPKAHDFVPASQQESMAAKAWKGIKLLGVGINAVGNGLISMMGAFGSLLRGLALASGTGNSAFAGVPAVLGSDPAKAKLPMRSMDDLFALNKNGPSKTLIAPLPLVTPPSSPASNQAGQRSPSVGRNPNALFASLSNALEMQELQLNQQAANNAAEHEEQKQERPRAQRQPVSYAADDISMNYSRKLSI